MKLGQLAIALALLQPAYLLAEPRALQELRQKRERSEIYVEIARGAKSPAEELRKLLPPGANIISYSKSILLIRLPSRAGEDLLAKVRRVRGVAYVDFNRTLATQAEADSKPDANEALDPCAPQKPLSPVTDLTESVLRTGDRMRRECGSLPSCRMNGEGDQLWAQKRVDREAMLELMKKWGLDSPAPQARVKVAIVDSGFDEKGMKARKLIENGPEIRFERGFPESGDPRRDELGHGTSLFSLLRGKDIALAPQAEMTVYRSHLPGRHSGPQTAGMLAAIENACLSGNSVIILSAGGLENEGGKKSSFSENMKAMLKEQGCTVVHASGNRSVRDVGTPITIDDPDLLVASIDRTGSLSSFSSRGMLRAPGSDVYYYPSMEEELLSSFIKGCGNGIGSATDGTSLAGPIAGAILAQVETVLKSKPEHARLTGPQKVALRNRILQASEFGGSVNGARAVLIARNWSGATDPSTLSTQDLRKLVNQPEPHALCSQKPGKCAGLSCDLLRSCVKENGLRIKVCSSDPDGGALSSFLSDITELSDPDVRLEWFPVIRSSSSLASATQASYLKDLWNDLIPMHLRGKGALSSRENRLKVAQILSPAKVLRIAPEVIRSLPPGADGDRAAREIAELTLASKGLSSQIYDKEGNARATEDKGDDLRKLFKAIDDRSPEAFEELVDEWIRGEAALSLLGIPFARKSLDNNKMGEVLWGMDVLRSDPEFKRHEAFLSRRIESHLKDVLKKRQPLPDNIQALLERGLAQRKAEIKAQALEAMRNGDLSQIGRLEIRYLVNHADELGDRRNEFLSQVLAQADTVLGWGVDETVLSMTSIKQLSDLNKAGDPDADSGAKILRELPERVRSIPLLGLTYQAYKLNQENLRQFDPSDLLPALREYPGLSVYLDDSIHGLMAKRIAMSSLKPLVGAEIPDVMEVMVIRDLIRLPDLKTAGEVTTTRPALGDTTPARSNADLADELIARVITRAQDHCGDLATERQGGPTASVRSRETCMSSMLQLRALNAELPGEADLQKESWKRVSNALTKFRRDPLVQNLRTPSLWLNGMLRSSGGNPLTPPVSPDPVATGR